MEMQTTMRTDMVAICDGNVIDQHIPERLRLLIGLMNAVVASVEIAEAERFGMSQEVCW